MAKAPTSFDVAQLAGVSQSTVSRVFSDKSDAVNTETRRRVLMAAQKLKYRPNVIARMMSTNKTNIVGIVMANVTSPFYPYVLDKFLQALQISGRQALLFSPAPGHDVDALLPLVLQHRVDALIITSAMLSSEMAEECRQHGTPVILFNRYVLGAPVSAVCSDNVAGGRLAADVLLDAGHERLAYISGTAHTSTNTDRERGFFERLRERGYTNCDHEAADYTYETGYDACRRLLRRRERPDAIFCANDIIAIGAMDAARALGVNVPGELSIIGYDDIPMAGWHAFRLTTISQEVDPMIAATMALLAEKINDPNSSPQVQMIPGKLKVRGSVRGIAPQDESRRSP
jgi:DNA-binding LacI/PurR family transcriptional regulator